MNGRFHALAAALAAGLWSCVAVAVDYRVIAEQNLFDPQRKSWAEPAPPAAQVPPFGPDDVQVQGVVVFGGVKRAIIRLGGRLRQLAPGGAAGRTNVILSEGQSLGGYTLESVEPQQVVFAAGAARFAIAITRSAPREMASAAPALPVIQSPTAVPESVPAQPAPSVAVPPQFAPLQPMAMQPAPQFAPQSAPQSAPVPVPAQAPGLLPGAQPAFQQAGAAAPASPAASPGGGMSLLEAIQAAEAARRAGQPSVTIPVNPFAVPK